MKRQTSIDAYNAIKENGLLSLRRFQVYDVLFHHGPLTANQVVDLFTKRYKHYHLTNTGSLATRLSELRTLGVVYEVNEVNCPISSYKAIQWDVTDRLPANFEKEKRTKCPHCKGKGYFLEQQSKLRLE